MVKIVAAHTSPRFLYIADWIFNIVFGTQYEVHKDASAIRAGDCVISYGNVLAGAINIPDEDLLWERDIKTNRQVATSTYRDIPVFFSTKQNGYTLPFDIFSAAFFLLSRYEEYYQYTPDKHGRYPASDSILYKTNSLEKPVVDIWLHLLADLLKEKNESLHVSPFSFLPTYDIDIAFSYRFKGFKRTAGAFAKDILAGKVNKDSTIKLDVFDNKFVFLNTSEEAII